jgi:hypothetical protein
MVFGTRIGPGSNSGIYASLGILGLFSEKLYSITLNVLNTHNRILSGAEFRDLQKPADGKNR